MSELKRRPLFLITIRGLFLQLHSQLNKKNPLRTFVKINSVLILFLVFVPNKVGSMFSTKD